MGRLLDDIRRFDREHLREVWRAARDGRLEDLPEDDRALARILLDHPESSNQFEFADLTADHEFDPERETNPFLHIALHQAAEQQLAAGEPPEASAFVEAMVGRGADRHEAIHLLCVALTHLLFHGLRGDPVGEGVYAEALRRTQPARPALAARVLERVLGRLLSAPAAPSPGPADLAYPVVRRLFEEGPLIEPEALRQLVSLGEAAVPDLVAVLHEARLHAGRYADLPPDQTYFPLHALFLLAAIGPGPWFPEFLEFLRQDGETLDFWFGDMVTEDLWEIVVRGGEGHLPEVEAFLGDSRIDTHARGAVSAGLAQLAVHRPGRRDDALSVFRRLLVSAPERAAQAEDEGAEAEFLGGVVADLLDLGIREAEPEIRQVFEAGLVDETIVGSEEEFIDDASMVRELLPIEERYEEFRTKYRGQGDEDAEEPDDFEVPVLPYVREDPKVGRNEPCPCGSGRKYKKCCGR